MKTDLDKLRQEVQQLCVGHGVHPLNRHSSHLLIWEPGGKHSQTTSLTSSHHPEGHTRRAGVPDCPNVQDRTTASAEHRFQEGRTTASRGRWPAPEAAQRSPPGRKTSSPTANGGLPPSAWTHQGDKDKDTFSAGFFRRTSGAQLISHSYFIRQLC